ncbi:MAG: 6-phosphofructokinase [Deltaproteobacteria bacterium]
MKIGILTGGGDCPGLNPVIRGVVRKAHNDGHTVVGFRNGWKGIIENDAHPLDIDAVAGILHRGGTILGTSRTNPYKHEGGVAQVKENFKKAGLDVLIAIGGEDTLGVANKLHKEGLHVIGVPKTIDNDLCATDYTFGFDTAVNIAMEAIDRLHTTAESHHRVIVVEVMGRHAGWIAAHAGLAGGADVVLVPEIPVDLEEITSILKKRHARGRNFSIVVAAEGAQIKNKDMTKDIPIDQFGHKILGGIGDYLAKEIEKTTGFESRAVVLGHLQRGGSPTAFDRVLGSRFGVKAVELAEAKEFGKMVSLQGTAIKAVPLEEAVAKLKTLDNELYETAKVFFG